jgi:alpha-L-fucosidase
MFVHYTLASLLDGGKPEYVELTKDAPIGSPEYTKLADELVARFTAENFDADKICDLAVRANMKYVTFTTCHLGRLAMYRTKTTDFTSLNSPAKRDLAEEMVIACRKKGLGIFFYVNGEIPRDENIKISHIRLRELLTQYGPISGIWIDGISKFLHNPEDYSRLQETYDLIRSIQPQCLISFKEGALGTEDFITPEHFLLPFPVEWDTAGRTQQWNMRLQRWNKLNKDRWEKYFQNKPAEINSVMQVCSNRDAKGRHSGWINDNNAEHLTADEVLYLYDIARSLGANLLMNIGPLGDGSIHPKDEKALTEVGQILKQRQGI